MRLAAVARMAGSFALAAGLSPLAHGAQDGDAGETTFAGAAVAMHVHVVAAHATLERCDELFPEFAQVNAGHVATWLANDAKAIVLAEDFWLDHDLIARTDDDRARSRRMLDDLLSRLSDPALRDDARVYCADHFAELANGLWRRTSPDLYRWLDPHCPCPQPTPGAP